MWPSKTRKSSIVFDIPYRVSGESMYQIQPRSLAADLQIQPITRSRHVQGGSRPQPPATVRDKDHRSNLDFIPKGVLNSISWEPLIEIYIFIFLPTFHTNGTLLLKLADSQLGNLHNSACNDRHRQSFRPWWDAKKKPQGF